jgi:flavin-dependent dehydrogenase
VVKRGRTAHCGRVTPPVTPMRARGPRATRMTYDAIVVGARCAGAPTAMLLARAGARVLLVDRASFPSDTISGHAIKSGGTAYLQQWGLLDAVLASGCPPIYDCQISVAGQPLPVPTLPPGTPPIVAPRRTVLDQLLVQAAASAGADVHEQTSVMSILRNGEQVIGIEARSQSGRQLRALAPIVIGADGKHSFISHQVSADYRHYEPPVSILYYAYWNVSTVDVALHFGPGRVAGLFPTNDGQVLAFVQCRWSEREAFRADVSRNYLATLRAFPAVAEALAGVTQDGPIRGMLDLPAFFRQSYGPGWALAGDAAHHKDPLIARGITDAFRDADLLARAVSAGLGGEIDLTPALARYQELREATSRPISAANQRLAELPDDPAELLRRLVDLIALETHADTRLAG